MRKAILAALAMAITGLLFACASMPSGAVTVKNFEKARYLGKWYEIARYDFAFEKDLSNTTAEYALLDNGYIGVTNRGFNYKKGQWEEAKGQARFRGSDTVAELEVSFFGPFYAAYNVVALDPDYKYALVVGSNTSYIWILSREKTMPDDIKSQYLGIAESLGYDLGKLVWVEHDK